jgi:hypoxanthine phosphoribosyltransferase
LKPQPKLNLLYSRRQIAETVNRLAAELNRDYPGKHPVLIGVLKGSFMFLADLIRLLDFPLEVDFVRLSSYGAGQKSSGKIKVVADLQKPVKDRDVLVVEDIVDTGLTTGFLLAHLRKQKPSSLKLCALTEKPSRRKIPVAIDYLGFTVPDKFIVGYGLDWDERFRNLPGIYVLEE